MDLGEPEPDPFEGMSAPERKRAMETAILEMAYDLAEFERVEAHERPDFIVQRRGRTAPFGVEVTQIFPSESIARINLIPGYQHRLWDGKRHLHKEDVKQLQSVRLQVTDEDGNVKLTDMPGILTRPPTFAQFRRELAGALMKKAEKGYPATDLSHLDLVILDWFHLGFDSDEYHSGVFLDDGVREALNASPFREVFLVVAGRPGEAAEDGPDAPKSTDEPVQMQWHCLPLRLLLLMERLFVTGSMIDEEWRDGLRDVAHLNALTVDHVSRVQGYGDQILDDGRVFLRYHGSHAELSPTGMQVRDMRDWPGVGLAATVVEDRLPPQVEVRVAERASQHVFSTGFAPRANSTSLWTGPPPTRVVRVEEIEPE